MLLPKSVEIRREKHASGSTKYSFNRWHGRRVEMRMKEVSMGEVRWDVDRCCLFVKVGSRRSAQWFIFRPTATFPWFFFDKQGCT